MSGVGESAFEISEVKGLWFVTARRYAAHHYGETALSKVVERMKPRYREAMEKPLPSAWYEEEAMQEAFAAARDVLAPSDEQMRELFEGCTLFGITHFWRIALRVTTTEFALRMLPATWRHIRRGPGKMAVDVDSEPDSGDGANGANGASKRPIGRGPIKRGPIKRGVVSYTRFPYFDDVNYRLLVLGTLRPLMQISTGKPAKVAIVGHGKAWLTAHIEFD